LKGPGTANSSKVTEVKDEAEAAPEINVEPVVGEDSFVPVHDDTPESLGCEAESPYSKVRDVDYFSPELPPAVHGRWSDGGGEKEWI
jgi:hypothetical protein